MEGDRGGGANFGPRTQAFAPRTLRERSSNDSLCIPIRFIACSVDCSKLVRGPFHSQLPPSSQSDARFGHPQGLVSTVNEVPAPCCKGLVAKLCHW